MVQLPIIMVMARKDTTRRRATFHMAPTKGMVGSATTMGSYGSYKNDGYGNVYGYGRGKIYDGGYNGYDNDSYGYGHDKGYKGHGY